MSLVAACGDEERHKQGKIMAADAPTGWTHVRTHQTADKCHGRYGGNHGKCGEHGGVADRRLLRQPRWNIKTAFSGKWRRRYFTTTIASSTVIDGKISAKSVMRFSVYP